MTQREQWLLLGLGAAALLWMFSQTQAGTQAIQSAASGAAAWLSSQIRGIRNNNPGNLIRTTDGWEGESAQQTDPTYLQFDAPEWGIRAMTRVLRNYFNRGANTLSLIITSWAPPTENDTASYIAAVASQTGWDPNAALDFEGSIAALLPAIIQHENGVQPYPPDLIAQGINLEATA